MESDGSNTLASPRCRVVGGGGGGPTANRNLEPPSTKTISEGHCMRTLGNLSEIEGLLHRLNNHTNRVLGQEPASSGQSRPEDDGNPMTLDGKMFLIGDMTGAIAMRLRNDVERLEKFA